MTKGVKGKIELNTAYDFKNFDVLKVIHKIFSNDAHTRNSFLDSQHHEIGYCSKCHVKYRVKRVGMEKNKTPKDRLVLQRNRKRKIPCIIYKTLRSNLENINMCLEQCFNNKYFSSTRNVLIDTNDIFFLPEYIQHRYPHCNLPKEFACFKETTTNKRLKISCYCNSFENRESITSNKNKTKNDTRENNDENDDWKVLRNIIITPYFQSKIKTVSSQAKKENFISQSLDDILNEVIPILLQRKNRMERSIHRFSQSVENTNNKEWDKMVGNLNFRNAGNNILSIGFTTTSHNKPAHTFCPKMMPGIQCTHFNTCVAFIKSNRSMKKMHTLLGDDGVREIFLNCIVLVPILSPDNLGKNIEIKPTMKKKDEARYENYLQICGPPLTGCQWNENHHKSKKRRKINVKHYTAKPSGISTGNKLSSSEINLATENQIESKTMLNSQRILSNINKGNETMNIKHGWNPNTVLPRNRIFYSDSFVKKIQLPSTHVMNIEINFSDHEKRKRGSLSQNPSFLLLDAILNISYKSFDGVINNRKRKCKEIYPILVRNKRWKRFRITGMNMCQNIRIRHRKTDYIRLLERNCPLPSKFSALCENKRTKVSQSPLKDLVHMHTDVNQVYEYFKSILHSVFPYPEFWGSEYNFHVILKTLRVFLNLRHKERFPMKAILNGIRVLDVDWLAGIEPQNFIKAKKKAKKRKKSDHMASTNYLEHMMRWLYCDYIMPLLKTIFYITETEFMGNKIVYYRKPIWSKIRNLSIQSLIKENSEDGGSHFSEIEVGDIQKILSNQQMGCSKLKLLPKKSGIRFIAQLSKRCRVFDKDETSKQLTESGRGNLDNGAETQSTSCLSQRSDIALHSKSTIKNHRTMRRNSYPNSNISTNMILREAFEILRFEYFRSPEMFGSGVLGFDGLHSTLQNFSNEISHEKGTKEFQSYFKNTFNMVAGKEKKGVCNDTTPLYFASCDIRRCYDNINQKHLCDIIFDIVREDDYLIQKYSILQLFESLNIIRRKQIHRVCQPEDFQLFYAIAKNVSQNYHGSIFVDNVRSSVVKKEIFQNLIKEHLQNHMVIAFGNNGQRYLLQKKGIPQGSILSTFLCNFYYGSVEDKLMDGVITMDKERNKHVLIRIVDDFLFISTSKDASQRFLSKMHKGIPELGIHINKEKTRVNYDVKVNNSDNSSNIAEKQIVLKHVGVRGKSMKEKFFSWCGLLFDIRTCEVRIDYSRFIGSKAVDSLTIDRACNEGINLNVRMKTFVRPRCLPLLYDRQINSQGVIMINFCQTILFCAVKTIHYVREGMPGGIEKNPDFFHDCIDDVIHYTQNLILLRLKRKQQKYNEKDTFCLTRRKAYFFGTNAFFSVLKDKMPNEKILKLLHDGLKKNSGHIKNDIAALKKIFKIALAEFELHKFQFI